MVSSALGWVPPQQVITGQTPYISKLLHFFYELVYYHPEKDVFPSSSNEDQGRWVGVATHVGDALTCKILTNSNKVIYRSAIRSALDPETRNLRLSLLEGETDEPTPSDQLFVQSRSDPDDGI